MTLEYKTGSTDKSIKVFIRDASVTTGAGLTGLAYNSAGLTAYYQINNGTPTAITLATLASATAAHSDGGFIAVDGTNMPGLYRLDLPDAVVATTGDVVIHLKGATNMVPTPKEIQVVANTAADIIALLPTALTAGGNMKVDVLAISGDTTAADNAEAFFDGTGYAGTNNVIPTVTTATNVTTVNGLAANVITAAATASDFGTEIGTAVWAAATRTLSAGTNIVLAKGTGITGFNDLDAAGVRSAVGLASANLDTQLAALPTDADVSAAVWNAATATYGSAGTYGALVETNLDAAVSSRLSTAGYTAPDNASISAILTDTGTSIPAQISGLNDISAADVWAAATRTLTAGTNIVLAKGTGITGFTDIDAAGVRTAVGLASANLDTQIATLATAANLATVDTVVDAIKLTTDKLDDTLEDDAGTYRFTTNALEQAPSGGGSLTAADVWAHATRTLTAGTNIVLAKGTGITGFNDLSAAEVNAEADQALADVGLTATITGRIDVATSTRLASASYTAPDNASIAAILVDTAEIGAAGAGLTALPWNAAWDTEVQSECVDALAAYTAPTKAEMDAAFADLPTATENADALLNRDMSAVSDTNSRTPLNALRAIRNKISTSSGTLTVTKEDDSTTAWTASLTTDGAAEPIIGVDPA